MAELMNQPHLEFHGLASEAGVSSFLRWRKLAASHMPEGTVRLHRRFTANQFMSVELGRRAALTARKRDHRLFTRHLVDLIAAVMAAPLSDETLRLLARDKPRSRSV